MKWLWIGCYLFTSLNSSTIPKSVWYNNSTCAGIFSGEGMIWEQTACWWAGKSCGRIADPSIWTTLEDLRNAYNRSLPAERHEHEQAHLASCRQTHSTVCQDTKLSASTRATAAWISPYGQVWKGSAVMPSTGCSRHVNSCIQMGVTSPGRHKLVVVSACLGSQTHEIKMLPLAKQLNHLQEWRARATNTHTHDRSCKMGWKCFSQLLQGLISSHN